MHTKMIGVLLKGYLPISLLPPSKLQEILGKVKKAIQITNQSRLSYSHTKITFIF